VSVRSAHLVLIIFLLTTALAPADIWPIRSDRIDDLEKLMEMATTVCRGEVLDAPPVRAVAGSVPRMTGIARVRVDKCYKGTTSNKIKLAVDEFTPGGGLSGDPYFIFLKPGEYDLFFLTSASEVYVPLKYRTSVITVSCRSGQAYSGNPFRALENDLVAGLDDPNHELVLKSILLLGALGRMSTTVPLKMRLERADELEKVYLWQALLRVKDFSVLPDATLYLRHKAFPGRPLSQSTDRLLLWQSSLFRTFFAIKDTAANTFQQQLSNSDYAPVRQEALRALRNQNNLENAPIFLKSLDEQSFESVYISMMALVELAGGGEIVWIRPIATMQEQPRFYADKCREWWSREGAATVSPRQIWQTWRVRLSTPYSST
jgi:hypothetical protein